MNVYFCNFKKSPKSTKTAYVGDTVFNFTYSQSGTGDPSPTNIRPILPGFTIERDDHTTLDMYGGSLDVTTGVLTVTWGSKLFSDLSWTKHSTYADTYYADVSDIKAGTAVVLVNGICSAYKVVTRGSQTSQASANMYSLSATNAAGGRIFVFDDSYQDLTAFETGTANYRLVYELATPQTIQLTASELQRACSQLGVPYPVHPVEHTTFDCTLHENTDIINPVIKLKTATAEELLQWNYCYIPAFSRYYFVDKVEWNLGTWLIYLSEDTLASNKTAIGTSTQYVTRAASEFDGNIIDLKYPTKTNIVAETYTAENNKTLFGTTPEPWFVVGIIGGVKGLSDQTHYNYVYNGSVCYYCMQMTSLQIAMRFLLSADDFNTTWGIPSGEISEPLAKQLINPIQYIHSIRIVPFQPETIATALYINVGFNVFPIPSGANVYICKNYDITNANIDNGYVHKNTCEIYAPVHPDFSSKGRWVQSDPYTKYIVVAKPFGRIEIPSGIVNSAPTYVRDGHTFIKITLETLFDISTGMCTLRGSLTDFSNAGGIFCDQTLDLTVAIPFHQTVQDYIGYGQAMRDLHHAEYGTARDMLGALLDLDIGSALNAGENAIQQGKSAIDNATMANRVQVNGTASNGAQYNFHRTFSTPQVECYFTRWAAEYNTDNGRPLYAPRQLNTLSGYIQCQNADFKSSALARENRIIEQYMNGGFFYE